MDTFGFIEGQHYLGYTGVSEMLEKIGWVQDHQEQAERMAERARKYVQAHHTNYHRALELLGRE